MKLPAFRLRGKLAVAALLLAALPWVGWLYVEELERFLSEAQEQALVGTARAVATALHDRPGLLEARPAADNDNELRRQAEEELRRLADQRGETAPTQAPAPEPDYAGKEVQAILKGLERSTPRIWVVNRQQRVLALTGSLRQTERGEAGEDWIDVAAHALFAWIVGRPSEDFDEARPQEALASGREIAAAFLGAPRTAKRQTSDGKAVIVSAAYPIWSGNEVVGAVVAEASTNAIQAVRSRALERLLLFTLIAFVLAAGVLGTVAARISGRIRTLRDEAEGAIDAQGRIARPITGSNATDEIGDLSRSFSALLARLGEHHAYLETMASRLSHELRTPIAVVRSSIENLKLGASPEEARVYLERAEEGLARLNTILTRMGEAARLEQGLAATSRERFDLSAVVAGSVEGYRLAFSGRTFSTDLPTTPVVVDGSPDLIAQLLDKLVDNANDFAVAGTPIHVALGLSDSTARLSVTNRGPDLPEDMRERLFASMVSVRKEAGRSAPHLGLGLHIARLIAEFHRGRIRAENAPGGGVSVVVEVPLVRESEFQPEKEVAA